MNTLSKTKSTARWNGLSARQRETLETWLFEENLGFGEALERARNELGFDGSLSSLKRFYHRTADERMIEDYAGMAAKDAEADSTDWLAKGMNVVGKLFLRQVTQNPDGVEEWWRLAKLLLQNRGNELRERLQGEENRIRQDYLQLARERHQYDVLEEAEKALPELNELEQLRKDPKARKYERNRAMNMVLRKLFGVCTHLQPESEEQEGRMAELQAQEMERSRKAGDAQAAETFRDLLARHPESATEAWDKGVYKQFGITLTDEETARMNAVRARSPKTEQTNNAAEEPSDWEPTPEDDPEEGRREADAGDRSVYKNGHESQVGDGEARNSSSEIENVNNLQLSEGDLKSKYPFGQ